MPQGCVDAVVVRRCVNVSVVAVADIGVGIICLTAMDVCGEAEMVNYGSSVEI